MRKKGWTPQSTEPHYCECGCGGLLHVWPNGFVGRFIKGHHLKGKCLSVEYRVKRTRNRWNKEPILSPFLENTFISFNEKMQRWVACLKHSDGISKGVLHSNAVYRKYHGDIPEGYVVHHKDNRHSKITDDRPENLMLLLDEWNLRFFPVLAKGFGVEEKIVTDTYLSITDRDTLSSEDLFAELCSLLARKKK